MNDAGWLAGGGGGGFPGNGRARSGCIGGRAEERGLERCARPAGGCGSVKLHGRR